MSSAMAPPPTPGDQVGPYVLQELLGVGGDTPVYSSIDQAPNADVLIIGIAPAGGDLPKSLRLAICRAIE